MKDLKKHIGILGLGVRSTLFYLQELNKRYQEKLGHHHTFPCIVYHIDFDTLNPFLPNQFDKIIPSLKTHLDELFSLPIKRAIIPNITLHEAFDLAKFNYPIAHPLSLMIKYLKEKKIHKVTLFGSRYTMQSTFIKSFLKNEHIDVRIPSQENMDTLDIIRQKVYNNKETHDDIEAYMKLIKNYSNNATILIACTELSILNNHMPPQKSIVDLTLLQIEEVLKKEFALEMNEQ